MVIRPSSSQWSVSPETIMSHHYRLTRGVKSVVDMSPPYSMYNSPISVHYIPRRSYSADAARRNLLPKPHRELSAFINNSNSLKLPLPLRSSRNELVKPKLLGNRNYHPPTRRPKKPPLPVPETKPSTEVYRAPIDPQRERKRERYRNTTTWITFKDCVYSYIIQRGVFSDGIIVDTVESEMEKWEGQMSWTELELLREEIYTELGVKASEVVRVTKARRMSRRANSMDSVASSSINSKSSEASFSISNSAKSSGSSKSSKLTHRSSHSSSSQSKQQSSDSDRSSVSSSNSSAESTSETDSTA